MTIQRVHPVPMFEPHRIQDQYLREYMSRLVDNIQQERSQRVKDFDILKLNNVAWTDIRKYGTKGDGSSDDITAIQAAIDDTPSGGILFIPDPDNKYVVSSSLTITSPIHIFGMNYPEINITDNNAYLFDVDSSNVTFQCLKMTSPQYTTAKTTSGALDIRGTSAASPATNIKILDCQFDTWGYYAILMQWVTDFEVLNNYMKDLYYFGYRGYSVHRGIIQGNIMDNITSASSVAAYGISLSRGSGTLAAHPISTDIVIDSNVIKDVVNWEGIDTHSAQRVVITNNTLIDCYNPIALTVDTDGYASTECVVANNNMEWTGTAGASNFGIIVSGSTGGIGSPTNKSSATIQGNYIKGYGDEDFADRKMGGIYLWNTEGCSVKDNIIRECTPNGIFLRYDNYNFVISGNTIIDPWTDSGTEADGIFIENDYNTGYIGENTFGTDSKTATQVLDTAINIYNGSNNNVTLGENHSSATTYISDVGGHASVLFASITWNPASLADGAGETSGSITVPGATVGDAVVVYPPYDMQDFTYSGYVQAANTVEIRIQNESGNTVDLASGIWKVKVLKY